MQVYGFLEKAQLENVSADLSNTLLGLIWYNTTSNKAKIYDGAVRSLVTEDGTATLTNKTFSGGTITGAAISGGSISGIDIDLGVASDTNKIVLSKDTKTNLDALTREAGSLFYATDEAKYYGDDGLNLIDLGSGGAGGISYVINPDAETNANDHVAYKDSASTVPDDGVGGSPTLSVARSTSSPLAETASFVISKPASNVQGEGINIGLEDFDDADKGKVHIISFEYDASDANYVDGDFRVYFRDDTNGVVYRVNGEDILGGKGTHYARIQIPIDCDTGSLLIHCAATHADAVSFKYDRVSFGPQKIAHGFSGHDSVDFDPSGTFTTNSTYTGRYSKSGQYAWIDYEVSFAGAPNAATMNLNLPSNLSPDEAKIFDASNIGALVGEGILENAGVFRYKVVATYNKTLGTIQPVIVQDDASGYSKQVAITNTVPFGIGSGDSFHLTVRVPIAGWSSQARLSEDFGGREIIVEASGNGATSLTANVTDIDFTETRDTSASWTGNTFIAPSSGMYVVTGFSQINSNTLHQLFSYVNGSVKHRVGICDTDNSNAQIGDRIYLEKGDVYSLRSNTNVTLSNNTSQHWISITKLANSQQVLETETVAARYSSNSGQSVGIGGTIVYEDLDFDTHNAYNTSTGIYTAPYSGYYAVQARARDNTGGTQIAIVVNGVQLERQRDLDGNGTSMEVSTQCVRVEKGQEVKIVSSVASTLNAGSDFTTFSIVRVG